MNDDYPENIEDEEVTEGETPDRAGENEFEDGGPIEQEQEVDTTFNGSQTNVISQCPVENGAIRTTWGAISGGPVISGIAGKYCQLVETNFMLKIFLFFQPVSINKTFPLQLYWLFLESEVNKTPDKVNHQQWTTDGQPPYPVIWQKLLFCKDQCYPKLLSERLAGGIVRSYRDGISYHNETVSK